MFEYNGCSIVAIAGKNCVAMGTDTRLGQQMQTINGNFQRVFKVNDLTLMGIAGLATDVQTFASLMKFKLNLYKLKEGREMGADVFSKLVSTTLYEKRFGPYFVSPVIAGLDKVGENEYKPVIVTYDSIGYREHSGVFETGGTAGEFLMGPCETYWREDLGPEDLQQVTSQCLLAGMDRDSLSGWGAYTYLLTPEGITVRSLKTRQD